PPHSFPTRRSSDLYSPAEAGMSMIPLALAAMAIKPLAKGLIDRFGYRRLLVTNTLLLGLLIASLGTTDADSPLVLLLAQLALIGACNSLQFSAMNTIALIDLDRKSTRLNSSHVKISYAV